MRRTLLVAGLVAGLVMAAIPADAAFQRLSGPATNNAHANIAHYDYGQWLSENPARSYGASQTIYVEVYACAQMGQGQACLDNWNLWVGSIVDEWRAGLEAYPGPNLKPVLAGPVPGFTPCSNPTHAAQLGNSDQIAVCVDFSLAPNSALYDWNFQLSNGAYHIRGGVLRIGYASSNESFWNMVSHELGHALGVGHRGDLGHTDVRSSNYGVNEQVPGSVMDFNYTNQYRHPDWVDFRDSVFMNGGYLTINGQLQCYNVHAPGVCPGYNSVG